MEPPPTFQNTNDPGGLSFLHAHQPAIVLGTAALSADVLPQAAAFIAARHLTYFRPGMYVRHLIPSGTGLKSWLFAAIKMIVTQFPIAGDLEGPVKEATAALERGLPGQTRDQLARIVSKLLQSGAKDPLVVGDVRAKLATLGDDAKTLFEAARADDFPDVAREADALAKRVTSLLRRLDSVTN